MRIFHAAVSAAVAAIVLGSFEPAGAALLSISGSGNQPLPASVNDLIPTPTEDFQALVPGGGVIVDPDASGLFSSGGSVLSTTADDVSITYNYIGSFAEAKNVFNAGGLTFVNAGIGEDDGGDSTPQPSINVVQAAAGLVDFGFSTNLYGGGSVNNVSGNNPFAGGLPSYLMSYLEPDGEEGDWKLTTAPTNFVLVLFDDAGRGADRNDYDDLGVIAVAAPLPASLPFFVTALGGLALMVWRRKTVSEPPVAPTKEGA